MGLSLAFQKLNRDSMSQVLLQASSEMSLQMMLGFGDLPNVIWRATRAMSSKLPVWLCHS